MIRYHSHHERRSRLADLENRRLFKQTALIILSVVIFVSALIFLGIPALIKLAIFLGDIRSTSAPVEQSDTIPPATPQIVTLPVATSSAELDISGYTEAGAAVSLYQNGAHLVDSLASDQGDFVFPMVTLNPGLNRFYAVAKDAAGNESPPSSTQTIVYDSKAPNLVIDNPKDGQQFNGASAQMITVSGTTDPDVSVKLNDRLLVVNLDGTFTSKYPLQDGSNPLHFVATDAAGNTTNLDLTVSFSN
jgi:large repetitive protein